MTDNDIPMWALNKAALFASFGTEKDAATFYGASHPTVLSIRAHAALIAKHEQPPVDPDLIEARECAALIYENIGLSHVAIQLRRAGVDDSIVVKAVLIRLQREKEGKHVGN